MPVFVVLVVLSSNRPEPRVLQVTILVDRRRRQWLSSNRPEPRVLQVVILVAAPSGIAPFIQSTRAKGTARRGRPWPWTARSCFHPIDPSQGYCKLLGCAGCGEVGCFHPIDPSQGYCKGGDADHQHGHGHLSSNRPEPRVLQVTSSLRMCSAVELSSNRPEPRVLQVTDAERQALLAYFHPIDPSQGYCKW